MEKKLKNLWLVYLCATVVFYVIPVVAPFMVVFPGIILLGAQAPYHLLLIALLLSEPPIGLSGEWLFYGFLAMEIGVVSLYVVTSLMLLKRKKHRPFGVCMIADICVSAVLCVITLCITKEFPFVVLPGLLGNTIFTMVFFSQARRQGTGLVAP